MTATEKILTDLSRKVDNLNRMVSELRKEKLKEERKETWVKVGTIQRLTIWHDKKELDRARREGLLKQRKGSNGIEYLLESIPEQFIKKVS
jgi:hypothetical protein